LILDTIYERAFGFSLGAYQFTLRHNLYQINDNKAIGISAMPCLGISYVQVGDEDATGFGIFNFPMFVSYETGAGSTFSTIKNKGFFIGAGYEISKMPLVWAGEHEFPGGGKIKTIWAEPICALGFRYWKKDWDPDARNEEKLSEIGVKFGFGSARPYLDYNDHTMTESRSWSFRAYYSKFFDY